MRITLNLELPDVQMALKALSTLPFGDVAVLIENIQAQTIPQLENVASTGTGPAPEETVKVKRARKPYKPRKPRKTAEPSEPAAAVVQ